MSCLIACRKLDTNTLINLLQNNSDVHETDAKGRTCLHISCSFGKEDMVKVLLENGADANARDVQGNTPLHYSGHENIVQLLYDYGADVLARNFNGDTPLKLMQRKGIDETTLQLMESLIIETKCASPISATLHHYRQNRNKNRNTASEFRIQSVILEFCSDLGAFYVTLLLLFALCLSLCVAYLVTGVSSVENSIPIIDGETSQKIEL